MNQRMTPDAFGVLIEPATLKIQRLLPGPIERVWAYLTQSELRRQWLAAGDMEMKVGAPFELVWRKAMVRTLVANALHDVRGDDMRTRRRQLARQELLAI